MGSYGLMFYNSLLSLPVMALLLYFDPKLPQVRAMPHCSDRSAVSVTRAGHGELRAHVLQQPAVAAGHGAAALLRPQAAPGARHAALFRSECGECDARRTWGATGSCSTTACCRCRSWRCCSTSTPSCPRCAPCRTVQIGMR